MRILRMLWIALGGGFVVFLIFAAFLYFNQNKLVFIPTREIEITPDEAGLSFEELKIEVAPGESIHGWYLPSRNEDIKEPVTVLFCHGNGGNISHRLETADYITRLGANLLLFDYRGYGLSDGRPSEKNCYADADAAYRWLVNDRGVDPKKIVVFGRSLGGGVATDLASRVQCGGLVVESSISSAVEMGRRMYPFMPVGLLIRHKFDTISKIDRVNCPVLVTHSPQDELVPYDMGLALYEKAVEPKAFVELSGGHNERLYYENPEYRASLMRIFGYRPNS